MRFSTATTTTAYCMLILACITPSQCSGDKESPKKKHLRGLAAATYDCEEGCDLNGEPVCGTDDVTYSNECLAVCQGAVVAKRGACEADLDGAVAIRDRSSYVIEGRVGLDVMNQFKMEGFNYVARRTMSTNFTLEEPEYKEGDDEDPFWASWPQNLRAVRITADGDEYVSYSSATAEDFSGLPDTTDAYIPMSDDNGNEGNDFAGGERSLKVLGQDTRVQQYSTKYPYSAIVQLELSTAWCTGTVISATSIVTNAHCVYDTDENTWREIKGASPGRTKAGENPLGFWDYATATIYVGYTMGRGGYDIAVVRLKPKAGVFIGVDVGYLPIARTDSANSALQTATITGYPGDKPRGTRWHSTCPDTYKMAGTYDVFHYCDTYGGNSGSALIDSNNYVRGVHWGGTSTINVGNILRGADRFYTIARWSGQGDTGIFRNYADKRGCVETSESNGNVYITECDHGDNQVWYYDKETKQIKSKHDDRCLDVNKNNNNNVVVWFCHGGATQKWFYDSERKSLKSEWNRNLCADYNSRSKNVYLYRCNGSQRQQWRVPYFFFR